MPRPVDLYDALSDSYDTMIAWEPRLRNELPFFRKVFAEIQARRVLDMACGTGQHAIAFAKEGYAVTAVDLSLPMIEQARANAVKAGVDVHLAVAGFGQARRLIGQGFDAVTCLGNSLPHLIKRLELVAFLKDMRAVLRPGGILVIQNRNYDRVWARKIRFMPVDARVIGGREALFLRFMDFHRKTLTFNILQLFKEDTRWQCRVDSTRLRPIFRRELEEDLRKAGFRNMTFYGDYQSDEWREEAEDTIALAWR